MTSELKRFAHGIWIMMLLPLRHRSTDNIGRSTAVTTSLNALAEVGQRSMQERVQQTRPTAAHCRSGPSLHPPRRNHGDVHGPFTDAHTLCDDAMLEQDSRQERTYITQKVHLGPQVFWRQPT
ncbi:hypothetical protein Rwratislav_38426 [Rhodococcus wratislaviensis IFP 2016]|nr:hypothetical protein Rwratislav_38426 [Rhodococcus wratislaviensis IFP 2016]